MDGPHIDGGGRKYVADAFAVAKGVTRDNNVFITSHHLHPCRKLLAPNRSQDRGGVLTGGHVIAQFADLLGARTPGASLPCNEDGNDDE